jgi:hypothetical protein
MDYFSYQSYTIYGEALESLIDFHIEPSSGKNPFHDLTATPETSGTYDLHVTRYVVTQHKVGRAPGLGSSSRGWMDAWMPHTQLLRFTCPFLF